MLRETGMKSVQSHGLWHFTGDRRHRQINRPSKISFNTCPWWFSNFFSLLWLVGFFYKGSFSIPQIFTLRKLDTHWHNFTPRTTLCSSGQKHLSSSEHTHSIFLYMDTDKVQAIVLLPKLSMQGTGLLCSRKGRSLWHSVLACGKHKWEHEYDQTPEMCDCWGRWSSRLCCR